MAEMKGLVKNANPQGTLEEFDENNINPAQYGCCCPRNDDPQDREGRIIGCREYKRCQLPEKGNAGPVIKGVRIIKRTPTGPRVIQRPMTCWAIPKEKQRVENSGGVLEIIANEGEKMEVVRALPVDTTVPSQGVVRYLLL
jgi:hypothetical protein